MPLINIDSEMHTKIFANRMQTYNKKIIRHDKVGFILEIQSCFSIFKSINLINYVNTLNTKIIWLFQQTQENFCQNKKCLHIKSSRNVELEETYLNMIKAINVNSTTCIILNGEKQKTISLKYEMLQECQLSWFLFNTVSEVLTRGIKQQNIKWI